MSVIAFSPLKVACDLVSKGPYMLEFMFFASKLRQIGGFAEVTELLDTPNNLSDHCSVNIQQHKDTVRELVTEGGVTAGVQLDSLDT